MLHAPHIRHIEEEVCDLTETDLLVSSNVKKTEWCLEECPSVKAGNSFVMSALCSKNGPHGPLPNSLVVKRRKKTRAKGKKTKAGFL